MAVGQARDGLERQSSGSLMKTSCWTAEAMRRVFAATDGSYNVNVCHHFAKQGLLRLIDVFSSDRCTVIESFLTWIT